MLSTQQYKISRDATYRRMLSAAGLTWSNAEARAAWLLWPQGWVLALGWNHSVASARGPSEKYRVREDESTYCRGYCTGS